MNLHDFLNTMSPDCPISLYDENDDCKKVFDGYCGAVTESIMFTNWKVTGHAFRDGEMLIWIR